MSTCQLLWNTWKLCHLNGNVSNSCDYSAHSSHARYCNIENTIRTLFYSLHLIQIFQSGNNLVPGFQSSFHFSVGGDFGDRSDLCCRMRRQEAVLLLDNYNKSLVMTLLFTGIFIYGQLKVERVFVTEKISPREII